MLKSIFALLTTCLLLSSLVLADQITIYSPPDQGIYHPKDIMDIRYHIHSIGMTKIWQTNTTLTYIPNNTTIDSFPVVSWNASNDNKTVHAEWKIPGDLLSGNYSMTVIGNVSRVCSVNSDGKTPFAQCQTTVYQQRYFYISNGTLTA